SPARATGTNYVRPKLSRVSPRCVIRRTRRTEKGAKEAAFLLEVKDWLNWMAYPARGLTIAYTTMFSESRTGFGYTLWQRISSVFDGQRRQSLSPEETRSSRVGMAHLAFPGLIAHSAYFRLVKRLLSLSGLALSLLSAFCLGRPPMAC